MKYNGKFEECMLLSAVDSKLVWNMSGVTLDYFSKQMQSERDYGEKFFKDKIDKVGELAATSLKENSWCFLGVFRVSKKTLMPPSNINTQVIVDKKYYYPLAEAPNLSADCFVNYSEYSFTWEFDPTIEIYIALIKYTLPLEEAEESEVFEDPKEGELREEAKAKAEVSEDPKEEEPKEEEPKEEDLKEEDLKEEDLKEEDLKEEDLKEEDLKEEDLKEEDLKEEEPKEEVKAKAEVPEEPKEGEPKEEVKAKVEVSEEPKEGEPREEVKAKVEVSEEPKEEPLFKEEDKPKKKKRGRKKKSV